MPNPNRQSDIRDTIFELGDYAFQDSTEFYDWLETPSPRFNGRKPSKMIDIGFANDVCDVLQEFITDKEYSEYN